MLRIVMDGAGDMPGDWAELTDLSTGVAANLGPGTVGVVAYPVEEGGVKLCLL